MDTKFYSKLLSVGVFMIGSYWANGNPIVGSEENAIDFGKGVAEGKSNCSSCLQEIDPGQLQGDHQKANIMKNLYLAHYHAGEFVEDFRVACLNKMLEVAQSYNRVEGSANFKIAYLLYSSQVSDGKLLKNAKIEIVEAVINKFAGAVNGDKELAARYLANFNRILKNSRLAIYASND
jgi:hypothetical protein